MTFMNHRQKFKGKIGRKTEGKISERKKRPKENLKEKKTLKEKLKRKN